MIDLKESSEKPSVLNSIDLLFEKEVKFDDIVSIKIPTVENVAKDKRYGTCSYVFNVSTRELFSPLVNVDELENKYPTIWEMIFDEENDGDIVLGRMLGSEYPASAVLAECFEYWTGLDKHRFRKLLNGKMVHEDSEWIVDKEKFQTFREAIRQITCYEQNTDLIAPKNMTPTRHARWLPFYKQEIKKIKRQNKNGIADKILILQASFSSYLKASEVLSMTYFQFLNLSRALSEKEAYLRNWEVNMSPKFEADINKVKHWSDKINV